MSEPSDGLHLGWDQIQEDEISQLVTAVETGLRELTSGLELSHLGLDLKHLTRVRETILKIEKLRKVWPTSEVDEGSERQQGSSAGNFRAWQAARRKERVDAQARSNPRSNPAPGDWKAMAEEERRKELGEELYLYMEATHEG